MTDKVMAENTNLTTNMIGMLYW